MLVNTQRKSESVLDQLDRLPQEFHLTGSRLSSETRVDSDWDFFVKDTPHIGQDLEWLGFVNVTRNEGGYLDCSLHQIWRHPDGVDVQIIKPEWFEAKTKANQLLLCTFFGKNLLQHGGRRHKNEVWTQTIQAIQTSVYRK